MRGIGALSAFFHKFFRPFGPRCVFKSEDVQKMRRHHPAERIPREEAPEEIRRLWERIAAPAGTRARIEARTMRKIAAGRRLTLRPVLQYAAMIVLALIAAGSLYRTSHPALSDASARVSIRTPSGARTNLTLPDGTEVWLNAGSELSYPTDFDRQHRTVQLSGEAYFEVTEDRHSPFRVEAANFEVTVLGTRFNVHSYADEAIARVTLVEGSVQLRSGEAEALLRPGERAELDRSTAGSRFEISSCPDTESELAWRSGRLVFRSEPFRAIARRMERRYGVTIEIADTRLSEERLTGEFDSESLTEALQRLQTILHYTYRIENDRVTIRR